MTALRATLVSAFFAASANATPTFTSVIQRELMMQRSPPGVCGVCHRGGLTTAGTVTTPFGRSLRSNGLMANDEDSLKAALAAIDAANTDSDRDGCSDIAELKSTAGPNGGPTNPNRAGDCGGGTPSTTEDDFGPVLYGCGANAAPGALLVALAAWLGRRRRA